MKSPIKFKTTTSSILVIFAFCCLAFCPLAQAVLPPPDGSHPAGNTAEGQSALLKRATGRDITQLKFSAIKEQAVAARQQEEIKTLAGQLNEQAAQIQRVSAEVQLSKASPQTVSD